MTRKLTFAIVLLLAVALSSAAQDVRSGLQTVLSRHVPNAQLPNDLVISGEFTDWSGQIQPFQLTVKGKDQVRYDIGAGERTTVTVFNKGGGWTLRNGKRELLQPHSAAQRPVAIVPFLDLVAEAETPDLVITNRGVFTLNDRQAQGLTLKMPDKTPESRAFQKPLDEEIDIYVEAQSGLVMRSERWSVADNNMSMRIRSIFDFSDYRSVQGLAMPFRVIQTLMGPGLRVPQHALWVIQRVTVNSGVTDADFSVREDGR